MEFEKIIKILRINKGIYQSDIENDTGIKQSTISKFEKGQQEPNLEQLNILADYFNVSTDFLLGRANNYDLNTLEDNLNEARQFGKELKEYSLNKNKKDKRG